MATRKKESLSDSVAHAALPGAGREFIWDTKLAGFGLRIEASGSRVWVVKYRAEGGGRSAPVRWLTIGPFPKIKAKEARDKAKRDLAIVRLGGDPAGDLAAKRREMTMAQLVELYCREGLVILKGTRRGEPMKPTTAAYTKSRLEHHVVPLLGKRRVTEITPGDVAKFSRDVAAGKTAKDEKIGPRKRIIVRGGDGAARKLVRDLSALFTFAIQHRIVSENPVATASVRKTDNKRERFLSLDEVKRLGAALDELGAEGMNPKAANITRLWALTGCRRNEIAGLKWAEVDLDRGLLVLEDSKTGKSTRPLGAAAWALLKGLRAEAKGNATFVFPAERGEGFYHGTKRVWPSVVKKATLPGVTPHTLRHTLGGAAASGGEALLMVGAILGHANARSTQIYAHIDATPARLAADRATAGIAAAIGAAVEDARGPAHLDSDAIVAALKSGRELPADLAKALADFAKVDG
jgi:integrase